MLVENVGPEDEFMPFSLRLTFETPEEAGEFFAIHNYVQIINATPKLAHRKIQEALTKGCRNILGLGQ